MFLDEYKTVSDDLGKYASKNWCIDRKKIKTIHNGIDTEKYRKIKADQKLRSSLGIGKKDKVIGIVAGLRPVKDHFTAIKAMEKVKEEIPNCKMLIVGDGPEREKLEKFAEVSGLEDNIHFLGNRKDTVDIYNCFDAGVLSSLSECLSITLLEGMACEKLFIATAVGGNPEVIENGTDGFLVPAKNPGLMADMIIQALKSKKVRQDMGNKARKKITERFNSENMAKRYEELYLK